MPSIGYTLMCEQSPPRRLVEWAVLAERAGFDFAVISDHFHPWLDAQGQSPFAWSVLGAVAERTGRMELLTAVTCPTIRYHPAIVAQAAATVALLSDGRFSLGVGAGENLNEHVVGQGWPPADVRGEMLEEAVEIIRSLWGGGFQSHHGEYFELQDARLYTLPQRPPAVVVAAGGPRAAARAGRIGDALMATEPRRDLVEAFRSGGGEGKPVYGQFAVCWAEDPAQARRTARELWRFSLPGWKVMSELPNPVNFDAATSGATEQQVAELVVCGSDPEQYVERFQTWFDAGFDHVCVVQVGQEQEGFIRFWEEQLRERLSSQVTGRARSAAPAG